MKEHADRALESVRSRLKTYPNGSKYYFNHKIIYHTCLPHQIQRRRKNDELKRRIEIKTRPMARMSSSVRDRYDKTHSIRTADRKDKIRRVRTNTRSRGAHRRSAGSPCEAGGESMSCATPISDLSSTVHSRLLNMCPDVRLTQNERDGVCVFVCSCRLWMGLGCMHVEWSSTGYGANLQELCPGEVDLTPPQKSS